MCRQKTLCLSNDAPYNLTRFGDIVDERAGFAGNHPGYIEIAGLAGRRVFATDLFGCTLQLVFMS